MKYSSAILLILGICFYSCTPDTRDSTGGSGGIDREYRLHAFMTGYIGIGGDIDGVRNPVLRALKGETIQITMINGETMTHDVTMEKAGAKSPSIIEKGDSAKVTFTALEEDVYYCSIPGHRATMNGRFMIVDPVLTASRDQGVIPLSADSLQLNFDFEYNSIDNWTPSGTAFNGQPSSDRESDLYIPEDMKDLSLSGQYFVTSGGTNQYRDTGTLTSEPFMITHPYAAFKVSGGALKNTRVELRNAGNDNVIFEITGTNDSRLRPVVADLSNHQGEKMYIRLVDQETGDNVISYVRDNKYAYISFDDFRFYNNRPFFTDELRPEDIVILPPRDAVEHAGLSGPEAVKAMDLPKDFSIDLVAAEPEVVRPIASAMDERGRLWVVEGRTYPVKAPEGQGKDRILIFEDSNNDGNLDKRRVFYEGLNLVSGIEVGHGGVWIGAAPELLYIPIDESGSRPAGKPKVLLDGWGLQDTHETLNSLIWGPDGWLYGTHGVFTHSLVGKPGTPEAERHPINAGVWRYHPTRHEFEVFAWGTSNPWGIDFNQYGHAFITACVIPHLYHMIQGGRYKRQGGKHFNPYVYDDIKTIADHVHWVGNNGPHAGNFRSASAGGGHAHSGAAIYQGAEHWPEEMRNAILMNNIHGYRTNSDVLERDGSGYTSSHGDDFILTNDSWSQWLDYVYGPAGSMYVIDWYDKNQCHSSNPDVHDKTLGRIFKISHKDDKAVTIDLAQKSNAELVEYQLHPNEWYVRHSRLLLQARGRDPQVHSALRKILTENPDITRKLRALWALHVTEGLKDEDLTTLLDHENEYIRSWAIQLLVEDRSVPGEASDKLAVMAKEDESKLVRLYISSALQRIPVDDRWDIIAGLVSHFEDVNDHNLPLMNWYAFEPLIDQDVERAMKMALEAEQPVLLQYAIRKAGSMDSEEAKKALKVTEQNMEDKFTAEQNHEIREELDLLLSDAG